MFFGLDNVWFVYVPRPPCYGIWWRQL